MIIIKPPHLISKTGANIRSIFLAGSIEMGIAEDWQTQVENFFKHYPREIVILNPRRDAWDSSWSQDAMSPQFYQQVNWELNALEKSDMIIMYFSPDTKSPISLLEFGKFADSGKILVCCPTGFWKKGNVDIVCERYGIPNYSTLIELLEDIKNKELI
jgi:hypothetical protein